VLFSAKMVPRWFEKIKSKVIRPREAASQGSTTPSQSVSQPSTQSISEPTPCPPTSTEDKTPPLPALQERLWNEAYDELKASGPKVVEEYEKTLSIGLHQNQSHPKSMTDESTEFGPFDRDYSSNSDLL